MTQTEEGTPLKTVLADIRRRLAPKYGEREAQAMARIIFENLKGWNAVELVIRAEEPVSDFIAGRVDEVVERLLKDEPIQQIFGVADFYGMTLKVTRDTLIPRPETAELVDLIVRENQRKDLRVLDAGTGSGCIAVALARNLPFPEITAIDISDGALAVARENARTLRCDVSFLKADMLSLPANLPGEPFDIIVSNPPYIAEKEKGSMEANVLEYEPATALFVPDSDPLKFYRALIGAASAGMLAEGGKLYFEINPLFARALASLPRQAGFAGVTLLRDTEGKERFLTAVKPTRD